MNKKEFLNRLEDLLQDIKEEERSDAIAYYRDYLEEAGEENEAEVLTGFGSPERVAAMIRTDLLGGMDKAGEFTESGFADHRFETSSLPAVRKPENHTQGGNSPGKEAAGYRKGDYAKQSGRNKKAGLSDGCLKFLLIAAAVVILGPTVLALAFSLFGGAIGLGGALLALLLALGLLTLAGFICGILLFVFGISQLFINVWSAVLLTGLGLLFFGIGCLLFILAILFYGKFLPWLIRSVIDIAGRIFGKKQNRKKDQNGKGDAE